MTRLARSPQNAAALDDEYHYYFERPQEVFGPGAPIPPPPTIPDFEIIEEVATVFDNMIYNETGGGNDGQVVVTQS